MKKILSIALVIAMMASMLIMGTSAATWTGAADTTWYDASKTEFTLTTAEQLAGLAELVNNGTDTFTEKTIKLGADIVLNTGDYKTWGTTAPANEWTPIGLYNGSAFMLFKGTFDGQGHSISGMYINSANETDKAMRTALFGCVGGGVVITNLTVKNAYVAASGDNGNAIIAGQHSGSPAITFKGLTVEDVLLDAASNNEGVGLVFGRAGSATPGTFFEDCVIKGEIINAGNRTAGVYGYQSGGTHPDISFKNTVVDVTITGGGDNIAGLFAYTSKATNVTVENCAINANIKTEGSNAAAVLNHQLTGNTAIITIKDTTVSGSVEATSAAGLVMGLIADNGSIIDVINVAVTGTAKSYDNYVGAVVGKLGGTLANSGCLTLDNVYSAATATSADATAKIDPVGGMEAAGCVVGGATVVTDKAAFTAKLDATIWDTASLTLKVAANHTPTTPPTQDTTKAPETTKAPTQDTTKAPTADTTKAPTDDTTGTVTPAPTGDAGTLVWVALAAVAMVAIVGTALVERKRTAK